MQSKFVKNSRARRSPVRSIPVAQALAAVLFVLFGPVSPSSAAQQGKEVIANEASATFIDGTGQVRSVQSNRIELTVVRAGPGAHAKARAVPPAIEAAHCGQQDRTVCQSNRMATAHPNGLAATGRKIAHPMAGKTQLLP
jgi:hypothetical protein